MANEAPSARSTCPQGCLKSHLLYSQSCQVITQAITTATAAHEALQSSSTGLEATRGNNSSLLRGQQQKKASALGVRTLGQHDPRVAWHHSTFPISCVCSTAETPYAAWLLEVAAVMLLPFSLPTCRPGLPRRAAAAAAAVAYGLCSSLFQSAAATRKPSAAHCPYEQQYKWHDSSSCCLSVMNFDHKLESVYTSGPKKSS